MCGVGDRDATATGIDASRNDSRTATASGYVLGVAQVHSLQQHRAIRTYTDGHENAKLHFCIHCDFVVFDYMYSERLLIVFLTVRGLLTKLVRRASVHSSSSVFTCKQLLVGKYGNLQDVLPLLCVHSGFNLTV